MCSYVVETSVKPRRLVDFSLKSWIHWLSREKVILPLLLFCRRQLFMTMSPKWLHSGTKGGSLYFWRTCCYRCDIQPLMAYRRSSSSAGSWRKVLSVDMILDMQYLYSSFELLSLGRWSAQAGISQLLKVLALLSSDPSESALRAFVSMFRHPRRPCVKRLSKQMSALGCSKRGSLGSLARETSLASLLTNFLNSRWSCRATPKIQRMSRRWKSFFLILEFMRILFDMLEVRAPKLILSQNHSWLRTLWISASETTFFPSKLSRVPTQASQCVCRPTSLRCSMRGMKMFLGQFFSKARCAVARCSDEGASQEEDSLGKEASAFSSPLRRPSFFTIFMVEPRIQLKITQIKYYNQALSPSPPFIHLYMRPDRTSFSWTAATPLS